MFEKELREELDTFVHNVAWLRKHFGFTQKQMAKLLGIGVSSLRRLEKGDIPPHLSLEILLRIHQCFGICLRDQLKVRLWDQEKI